MAAPPQFSCPYCEKQFVEDDLWAHVPRVHGSLPNNAQTCPICKKEAQMFAKHLHDKHGPTSRLPNPQENVNAPTPSFALVVCQHPDGKFLLVDEPASWGWWLPAGRVDTGESFQQAAIREAQEEAGIDVELTGILRVEYTPNQHGGARLRVIFHARPKNPNQPPKSIPDYESQGAKWATFDEIQELYKQRKLRGREPLFWGKYIKEGGKVLPLDFLSVEGDIPPGMSVKDFM